MTNILAIVILTGASCMSQVGHSEALRVTTASKTPCAVVIRAPVANPFKVAQQPNEPAAAAPVPPVKTVAKKQRCGGRRVIWFKNKSGKRRYRCA
jgi:hypothetical protein